MKINNEIKIGLMVVAVLGLLAFLTIKAGNFKFSKKGYELKVQFQTIDGIATNAPVRLNGMEVGVVKDIKINYGEEASNMILTLWLDEGARIREGSKAYVKMMGFMGEKYVGLTFGDPKAPFLNPGAMVTGITPADFDQLMIEGSEVATQVKEIAVNINQHLKKNDEAIDRTLANLDVSMKNIASITTNVDERLKVNQTSIDEIIAHLHSGTQNLDEMTYDLKLNPWKLLYRPKYEKPKEAVQ